MKKELLMGTALVSTLGAASVAEAVTATMITTLLYHYLKLLTVE